jgi:opacity protein-like surface antigen
MKKLIPRLMSVVVLSVPAVCLASPGDYDRSGRGDRYRDDYDTGPYVGLSIGQMRYDEEGLDTITPAAVTATLGARLSPNVAIEGRIGGGLGRSDTNSYGVEVRSMYAGYIKGILPLSPVFSIYGLGGVAAVNLKRDFGQDESHDSGFSYGIGMDFNLPRGTSLNVEFTRLTTGNNQGYDYNLDMASVGVSWRF